MKPKKKKKKGHRRKVRTEELSDQERGRKAGGRFLIPQATDSSLVKDTTDGVGPTVAPVLVPGSFKTNMTKKLKLKTIKI